MATLRDSSFILTVLNTILPVFSNNILPIFIVAAFGFALRRTTDVDKRALSRVVFFVFSPALIFSLIVGSDLEAGEIGRLSLFALLAIMGMGTLAFAVGRALRLPREAQTLLMLAAMFGNSGNFGLALNELRYGTEGLARAAVYYTISGILQWTLGSLVAALGQSSLKEALSRIGRLPIIYAVLIAFPVYLLDLSLPQPVLSAVTIAGRAAVPVMLILLGMQLADVRSISNLKLALPAVGLRLLIAPLLAFALATALGLKGLGFNTSMLQASVPPAVATIVVATEYDIAPEIMTSVVVIATLLSPITMVALIQILGL
ncbi:MAG: AEC family transporter [Candidatus Promineifilaceae bacterium]